MAFLGTPDLLRSRARNLGGVLLAALSLTRPSSAQEGGEKAAAEALFQLGEREMRAGNYELACPKLEASSKLDPGVGTLLYLGDCQEKQGRLASAWATFRQAMSLAKWRGDSERASLAELRATALLPRVSRVTYQVDPRNDVPGFELRKDGVSIASGSWGTALPSDPGRFEVVARAPGYEPWSTTLTVPDGGDAVAIAVPPLRRITTTPSPPAAPVERARVAPAPESRSSAQKTWGAITAGVGAALAVSGGALAFVALRKNAESKDHCRQGDPNLCEPTGVEQRESAQRLANLAGALGIGGGAVLTTGAILYLTAPTNPQGQPSGLGFGIHATF
jgi:hypothetical protein